MIKATDNYGLSEVMGPGVAGECLQQNGLHINEDHFLVEVIDPDTLRAGEARGGRRAGHYDADERGLPDDPLSHPRPHAPHARTLRLRTHRAPHGARHGHAPTTC